jgi:hypothetical protein
MLHNVQRLDERNPRESGISSVSDKQLDEVRGATATTAILIQTISSMILSPLAAKLGYHSWIPPLVMCTN